MSARVMWHLEHLRTALDSRGLASYLDRKSRQLNVVTADIALAIRVEPRDARMAYVMQESDRTEHTLGPVSELRSVADTVARFAKTRMVTVVNEDTTYQVGERA